MKICTKCKEEKELSEFSKSKSSKDGLQYNCKACQRQYCRQYYAKNAEYCKQYQREYVAENPELKAERNRKYKSKYPEKRKAKSKANYNLPSRAGCHRHHWSYNEEHWLDIIYVDASMHSYYHTHMEYDSTHMMYRIKATGELLDTRERHEAYLNILNIKAKEVA